MKDSDSKPFPLEDFIKFGKKVFNPKSLFDKLYLAFICINVVAFSILMLASENSILILIYTYLTLLGIVIPLQWVKIKYGFTWKKNKIRENWYKRYESFKKLISKEKPKNIQEFSNWYGWYKKSNFFHRFRGSAIVFSIFMLIFYFPFLIDIEIVAFQDIFLEKNYNLVNLILNRFSIIIPIFIITSIVLFFFTYMELYINRFRYVVNEIIRNKIMEIREEKQDIINYETQRNDPEKIIETITIELNRIMELFDFKILGVLREPKFSFNLDEIMFKDELIDLLDDYETYLLSLYRDNKQFNEVLENCRNYLRNIKNRIYKENIDIRTKISLGESYNLEFKSSLWWDYYQEKKNRELEKPVVKTIAGFLNSKGGTLLIGVDDDGNILGLSNDYRLCGKNQNRDDFLLTLENVISNHFKNSVHHFLDKKIEVVDNKEICVIKVSTSKDPVYLDTGEFYIRTSARTINLNTEDAIDYIKYHFKI
jgi:ribosomal protein S19E (S16A)